MDEAQRVIEEVSRNYESELIKKVQKNRDKEAFYRLVRLYDARIYSVVFRFLRNREDSLEITQDVFLQVFRKIRQYRWESPFYFWIQRIAVNYSINRMKKYGRDILKRTEGCESVQPASSFVDSPEQMLEGEEKKKFVANALARISVPYRMAVILKDIEGFSYEEIALLTGTGIGTVKSRINRGREELREIFFTMKEEVKEYGM
ncbi:MAG: sigma-70 family RNA polymerase sigma factor [Candidatus Firestonebacteria bacterium]